MGFEIICVFVGLKVCVKTEYWFIMSPIDQMLCFSISDTALERIVLHFGQVFLFLNFDGYFSKGEVTVVSPCSTILFIYN